MARQPPKPRRRRPDCRLLLGLDELAEAALRGEPRRSDTRKPDRGLEETPREQIVCPFSLMSMRAITRGVGTALLLGVGASALGAFGAPRDVLSLLPGGVRPALAEDDQAEIGIDYRHDLPTHCGVEYAFFSGRGGRLRQSCMRTRQK